MLTYLVDNCLLFNMLPNLKKASLHLEKTLLFLVILFLPTQLGRHFWPKFSYIYSLKIDYLSPAIYFWDVLVLGLLTVWLLKRPKVNRAALSLFLFFSLTQVLSLLGAENMAAGLVRLEQYLLAGLFGIYLSSQDFRSLIKKIYFPLALAVMGEALMAAAQFIKGSTLGLWVLGERAFNITTPGIAKFDFHGSQFLRPYATFPHPNVLAAFMVISAIILSRCHLKKMFSLLVVLMSGLTVFLTMGRTAIFVGFVALLVSIKRKWRIAVAALLLLISPILFTRFSSLINFDNLTLLRREELFENAWQIFLHYPILGVGLNNFIPAVAEDLVSGPNRFLQPVHNIILLELAETGIVGFIGFLALVGYPVIKIFSFQFSIFNSNYKFKISNLLPWFVIFFLGLLDHYFLTLPQGYRLLFLVWGLSLSMLK